MSETPDLRSVLLSEVGARLGQHGEFTDRLLTGIKEGIERHTTRVTTFRGWLPGCRKCGIFAPETTVCAELLRWAALLGLGDGGGADVHGR